MPHLLQLQKIARVDVSEPTSTMTCAITLQVSMFMVLLYSEGLLRMDHGTNC